jgi:hypothetical protein
MLPRCVAYASTIEVFHPSIWRSLHQPPKPVVNLSQAAVCQYRKGQCSLQLRVEADLAVGSNNQDGAAQAIDTILSQK